jgi:hypothetical protein
MCVVEPLTATGHSSDVVNANDVDAGCSGKRYRGSRAESAVGDVAIGQLSDR